MKSSRSDFEMQRFESRRCNQDRTSDARRTRPKESIANLARKVTLSEIRIGKRYRREMGDIGELAASMEELGLLQPIVVTPDGTLLPANAVCGRPCG